MSLSASFCNNENTLNLQNVKWSSDISEIIENDEKDFFSNLDASLQFRQLINMDTSLSTKMDFDTFDASSTNQNPSHLSLSASSFGKSAISRGDNKDNNNKEKEKEKEKDLKMSWGVFFAKKSPPMGDISGTSQPRVYK